MHIYSLNLNALGAGNNPEDALERAVRRLTSAATRIEQGAYPTDPGVSFRTFDPGGGPCAPQKIAIEIIIDADILPEAQSRDDD